MSVWTWETGCKNEKKIWSAKEVALYYREFFDRGVAVARSYLKGTVLKIKYQSWI